MADRSGEANSAEPVISASTRDTIGLGLLAFLVGAIIFPKVEEGETAADPDNLRQVELGKAIYDQNCAVCHGARLEGRPNWQEKLPTGRMPAPPHDASGHTWHHADQLLFGITKYLVGTYDAKPALFRLSIKTGSRKDLALPPFGRDAVAGMAQNPVRQAEIAVMTFERAVFVSADAGSTWMRTARPRGTPPAS